ncbi:MAG: radical SAM protein [Candidatus Sigynarchaeota archaeon]
MSGNAWTPDKIGFVACYPNLAKAGLASLGMHVITRIAGGHPRFVADACFFPGKTNETRVLTTRFKAPLRSFSLVGFSCAFEPDYPNVPRTLQIAGIPLYPLARARARAAGERVPLVIAGGIAISSNPMPLLAFFDFIFLFDAEPTFPRFLDNFVHLLESGDLDSIEGLEAWWKDYDGPKHGIIPAFKYREGIPWGEIFNPVSCKTVTYDIDEFVAPHAQALTDPDDPSAALGTSYLLEVGRGCGEGCRFCLVGSRLRPPRFATLDKITRHVDGLKTSGLPHQKIALVATNIADHPSLPALCKYIVDAGYKVSIPSTKPLCDVSLLVTMQHSNIKTVAIAPETGSEPLRMAVNKKVTNAEYETAIVALLDHGISTVKIYLMFGLPSESSADIDLTTAFVEHIQDIVSRHGAQLTISLNPFVPKLGTPFMFHVDNYMPSNIKRFKRGYETFARRLEKICHARVDTISVKEAQIQAVLSLGGVELAAHVQQHPLSIPDDVVERVLIETKALLDAREFPEPIDRFVPIQLGFLKREWLMAMERKPSPRCAPPASCAGCDHVACTEKPRR